jgi:hypothetical protein
VTARKEFVSSLPEKNPMMCSMNINTPPRVDSDLLAEYTLTEQTRALDALLDDIESIPDADHAAAEDERRERKSPDKYDLT